MQPTPTEREPGIAFTLNILTAVFHTLILLLFLRYLLAAPIYIIKNIPIQADGIFVPFSIYILLCLWSLLILILFLVADHFQDAKRVRRWVTRKSLLMALLLFIASAGTVVLSLALAVDCSLHTVHISGSFGDECTLLP